MDKCEFNSTNPNDIEFTRSVYFNKVPFAVFSSSVGKFVGYSPFGLFQAEYFNNQTAYVEQMRGAKQRYCQRNIQGWYRDVLEKSGESASHHINY